MLVSIQRNVVASLVAALCALTAFPTMVQAQAVDKPMRVILPVGPGSGVDTIMRSANAALSKALGGQPVVIDNLPGAGGITGTGAVVKAAPDGLTIGVVSNNHVINPSVYKKMPFDAIADVTPIAVMGTTPFVLVVNPSKVPAKNVQELIAFLKAKPDEYSYGSSGNGTVLHLAGAMFLDQAGVQIKHVPYKNVGGLVTDLIGGQIEMAVLSLPSVQGHIKSGALRAIGVCDRQRGAAAPDIPTIAEQGLPNYEIYGWFAVIGPAKLPPAVVNRINAAFKTAFDAPEVKDAMAKQGNIINPTTSDAATAFFKSEKARYAELAKKANVTLD